MLEEQTDVFPEILPGVFGIEFTVTDKVLAAEEPQELLAFTVIFPPDEPAEAVIEVEVEEPDHPEGRVHVYEVAPLTADMLYVFELEAQMLVLPEILPGVAGVQL